MVEVSGAVRTWSDLRAELARERVHYSEVAKRMAMSRSEFGHHINGDDVSRPTEEFVESVMRIITDIVTAR